MTDIFDCSPRMAAKLARCNEIARAQRRYWGDPMAPFNPYYAVAMTDQDFKICSKQLPYFNIRYANA